MNNRDTCNVSLRIIIILIYVDGKLRRQIILCTTVFYLFKSKVNLKRIACDDVAIIVHYIILFRENSFLSPLPRRSE